MSVWLVVLLHEQAPIYGVDVLAAGREVAPALVAAGAHQDGHRPVVVLVLVLVVLVVVVVVVVLVVVVLVAVVRLGLVVVVGGESSVENAAHLRRRATCARQSTAAPQWARPVGGAGRWLRAGAAAVRGRSVVVVVVLGAGRRSAVARELAALGRSGARLGRHHHWAALAVGGVDVSTCAAGLSSIGC